MYYYPEASDSHQFSKDSLHHQLLQISSKLVNLGLNRGTSGNCSVRFGEHFLITPSGIPIEELSTHDMVEMDFSGRVMNSGKPSSEWRFHKDILKSRKEIQAVVHVHSTFATTLSCLHKEIPPFHYMISVAGGDSVRCAPYALFGSQELSDFALEALTGRSACLLANHGMIALGKSLEHALSVAVEVELLCEQYCHALQTGEPQLLSSKQMNAVLDKFKDYGRWK